MATPTLLQQSALPLLAHFTPEQIAQGIQSCSATISAPTMQQMLSPLQLLQLKQLQHDFQMLNNSSPMSTTTLATPQQVEESMVASPLPSTLPSSLLQSLMFQQQLPLLAPPQQLLPIMTNSVCPTKVYFRCAKQDDSIPPKELKYETPLNESQHWDELNTAPYKYMFIINTQTLPVNARTVRAAAHDNFTFKLFRMDTNTELPDTVGVQKERYNNQLFVAFKVAFKANSHDTFGKCKSKLSANKSKPTKKRARNQRRKKNYDNDEEEDEIGESSPDTCGSQSPAEQDLAQTAAAAASEVRELLAKNHFFQLKIYYMNAHVFSTGRIRFFARRDKTRNTFDKVNFGKESPSKRTYKKKNAALDTPAKRHRKNHTKKNILDNMEGEDSFDEEEEADEATSIDEYQPLDQKLQMILQQQHHGK